MQQTNADFLKDLLKNLGKQITPQWRVQQFSDQKPFAVVIPYLDKVDVMKQLDQYATYGWHREHYTINQDVYCRIGIVFPDNSIQWRSDVGAKGQVEEEKTKASDSFKRSASNWGIGRNLSETDVVRVNTNTALVKGAHAKPYVIDAKGNRVWDVTKFVNEQIKAGILKVENIFGNDNSEDKAPEPKAPAVEKSKKQAPPAKETPAKPSDLSPSKEFDTPDKPIVSKEDKEARDKAATAYNKLEASVVLAYLIKDKKIVKYATVTDFVNNHDLAEVRAIYTELTAKK